jgi:hypothetical protein
MPLYVAKFQFRYNKPRQPRYLWGRDSRLLRRGHWSPSQLEKKEASKSELEQLEMPF